MDYPIDHVDIDDIEPLICALLPNETVICNATAYVIPELPLSSKDVWFWIYIFLYIFLMLMSGVFSGLVLGLVTLDLTILKVLKDAGTPKVRKYATRITPLVENHHLLLVTLLLANAICMEALPLCLDRVSDPLTAMLISVTTVLFFGEVIPQAICARYGLAIGAVLTPFVYVLMGMFFIVSYPISKLLDIILGRGHGTFYRRDELKALVNLHGFSAINNPLPHDDLQHEFLTRDEVIIIQGALDMKEKTVESCMIAIEEVFMLSMDTILNSETMLQIQKSNLSRIPVYDRCRNNIQGILVVKCLVRVNPNDRIHLRHLAETKALRKATFISTDTSLLDLLNHFHGGKGHLAFVTKSEPENISDSPKSPTYTSCHQWCDLKDKTTLTNDNAPCGDNGLVVGIVTMEDIIEDLLQKDIFKERDTLQSSLNTAFQVALAKLSLRRNASTSSLGHLYYRSFNEDFQTATPSPTTCAIPILDNRK